MAEHLSAQELDISRGSVTAQLTQSEICGHKRDCKCKIMLSLMSAGCIERTYCFLCPSGKRKAVMYRGFKSGAAHCKVTVTQ